MTLRNRLGGTSSGHLAAGGAALLFVAAFLPWSVDPGATAYSGLDHDHGYLALVLAATVATVLGVYGWTRWTRLVVGAAGVLPLFVFAKWFLAIRAESVTEPAFGLYLTLVAGLVLLGGAAKSVIDETARERSSSTNREGTEPTEQDGIGSVLRDVAYRLNCPSLRCQHVAHRDRYGRSVGPEAQSEHRWGKVRSSTE